MGKSYMVLYLWWMICSHLIGWRRHFLRSQSLRSELGFEFFLFNFLVQVSDKTTMETVWIHKTFLGGDYLHNGLVSFSCFSAVFGCLSCFPLHAILFSLRRSFYGDCRHKVNKVIYIYLCSARIFTSFWCDFPFVRASLMWLIEDQWVAI